MELLVVMAQRRESYPGEYGLEALAIATEYDFAANPDYINEQLELNRQSGEFAAVQIVKMQVPEDAVRAILFPQERVLKATVTS